MQNVFFILQSKSWIWNNIFYVVFKCMLYVGEDILLLLLFLCLEYINSSLFPFLFSMFLCFQYLTPLLQLRIFLKFCKDIFNQFELKKKNSSLFVFMKARDYIMYFLFIVLIIQRLVFVVWFTAKSFIQNIGWMINSWSILNSCFTVPSAQLLI